MSICNNILDNFSRGPLSVPLASKVIFKTMIKKHHKIHHRNRDSVRWYLQRVCRQRRVKFTHQSPIMH